MLESGEFAYVQDLTATKKSHWLTPLGPDIVESILHSRQQPTPQFD